MVHVEVPAETKSSLPFAPRRRRKLILWSSVIVSLLALFHLGGGWYFSGEIYSSALEPDPSTVEFDIPVVAVGTDTVSLSTVDGPDELLVPGVWGLEWADGYGQLRTLVSTTEDTAVWELAVLVGEDLAAGDLVDLDVKAFPPDPLQAHGFEFTRVTYDSELGATPAWLIAGTRPTWVILLHGNGLTQRDVLRPLPPIVAAGYPALVITYRNHPEAPADPSRRLQYGLTEWRDLEAAVEFALASGAQDVVLVGYSMGGAIVSSFLYESQLASEVAGVVLDSPLLDLGAAVDLGAESRSLPVIGLPIPDTLTATAKWMAGFRYDVPWGDLDYLDRAEELSVPILLFHGTIDDITPVETSDELAELRSDLVTYRRVEGASHLQSWNLNPAAYELALAGFLEGLR